MDIAGSLFSFTLKACKVIAEKYYLLYTPFIMRKHDRFDHPNHIFDLLFKVLFFGIGTILLYHFPILFWFIYHYNFSVIGNIFRGIVTIIMSILLSFVGGVENSVLTIGSLFIWYFFYLLVWELCCALYLISFDRDILEIILFRKRPDNILELVMFFFGSIVNVFIRYVEIILIILHLVNPLSIVRIIEILCHPQREKIKVIWISFWFIFLDFILIIFYILNTVFIVSFAKSHLLLCTNDKNELRDIRDNFYLYCPLYKIIKDEIILNNFKKNFLVLICILLIIPNLIFIWRIKSLYRNFFDFYYHKQSFKMFIIRYLLGLNKTLLQIISFLGLIENHLLPFHFMSLYKVSKIYKNDSFFRINLFIFIQKWFDCITTLFSMTRVFTYIFNVFSIRHKIVQYSFFPLLIDNEKFLSFGKTKHFEKQISTNEVSLYHLSLFYQQRRKKILMMTISNLYQNVLLIFNSLFGTFDPFISLKIIKSHLYFLYVSLFDDISQTNCTKLNFKQIKKKFFCKTSQITINILYDIFFFLPLTFIMIITGPWCVSFPYRLLIRINTSRCNKIKDYKREALKDTYYSEVTLHHWKSYNKYNDCLKQTFKSWFNGYLLILKFIFIHMEIIRAGYLWYNYCCNNKKNKSLKKLISKHFTHAYMEFFYVPFIIIICVLEPWNIFAVDKLFKCKKGIDKFNCFKKLLYLFFMDLFTVLIVFFLILSITDTYSCIILIIRALNKNVFKKDSDSIAVYDANYKNDFKTELRNIYSKNLKKIFILIIYVLNYLCIFRVKSLSRRTKPMIKNYFSTKKIKLHNFFENIKGIIFRRKPKTTVNTSLNLTTLPNISIVTICNYLPMTSVTNLASTCKSLQMKTKSNVLWKQIYETNYKHLLYSTLPHEQFILFNPERYDNYKEACHQATLIILEKNTLKANEMRDKIIGFYRIVEEETLETLIRIPHLLLLPWKILGYIFFLISHFIIKINNYLHESQFIQNYFEIPMRSINHILEESNEDDDFYSIQTSCVTGVIILIAFTFKITMMIIVNTIVLFIKVISFTNLRVAPLTFEQSSLSVKINIISKITLFLQLLYLPFIFLLNIAISMFPSIYYFYYLDRGALELQFTSFLRLPIEIVTNIEQLVWFFWQLPLLGKIQIIFGKYGLSIITMIINQIIVNYLSDVFRKTPIFIYNCIYRVFREYQYEFILCCLSPMNFMFVISNFIIHALKIDKVIVLSFIENIIAIYVAFIPFIVIILIEKHLVLIILLLFFGIYQIFLIQRFRNLHFFGYN